MQMYDDANYARTRLVDTVVMCRGLPVKVEDIKVKNAAVRVLNTNELLVVKTVELDITPVKLGYLNEDTQALYLTRTPMREDWRQGLRSMSIRVIGHGRDRYQPPAEGLFNTILGRYPALDVCIDLVKSRLAGSLAFSRNFAIVGGDNLLYKGKWKVGTIAKTKDYNLFPQFDWVREMLDEELAAT